MAMTKEECMQTIPKEIYPTFEYNQPIPTEAVGYSFCVLED